MSPGVAQHHFFQETHWTELPLAKGQEQPYAATFELMRNARGPEYRCCVTNHSVLEVLDSLILSSVTLHRLQNPAPIFARVRKCKLRSSTTQRHSTHFPAGSLGVQLP
ncbi:hypothetical protein ABVK25_004430 [Lepraria finkii]|uniref:Uncharacterized protein n=1 Tax=Lepraria finkii TaxID=1340010 RepID=A0ABR4BB57_9LECA